MSVTHLKISLLDRHGNPSETRVLPLAEAIAKAAEFMTLLGTDPDEDGRDAAPGSIEFEPADAP